MSLGQVPSLNQSKGIVLVSCGLSLLARGKLQALARWPSCWRRRATALPSLPIRLSTPTARDFLASGSVLQLGLLSSFVFLAVTRILRGPALRAELNSARLRVIVSGLLGLLSFCVFLWALSRSPVGSVTTIRESSVLFATAIDTLVHALSLRRLTGAIAVLIALIATRCEESSSL
jgi:drug/metabolite transporter (DMT)-like permease